MPLSDPPFLPSDVDALFPTPPSSARPPDPAIPPLDPSVCPTCFKKLCNRYSRYRHERTAHKHSSVPDPSAAAPPPPPAVRLDPRVCHQCNRRFRSRSNRRIHQKNVHPRGATFKCPECNARFKTSGKALTDHRMLAHAVIPDTRKKSPVAVSRGARRPRAGSSIHQVEHAHRQSEHQVLDVGHDMEYFPQEMGADFLEFVAPNVSGASAMSDDEDEPIDILEYETETQLSGSEMSDIGPVQWQLKPNKNGQLIPFYNCPWEGCKRSASPWKANCVRHYKTVHLKTKEYECGACHKRFATNSNMNAHKCQADRVPSVSTPSMSDPAPIPVPFQMNPDQQENPLSPPIAPEEFLFMEEGADEAQPPQNAGQHNNEPPVFPQNGFPIAPSQEQVLPPEENEMADLDMILMAIQNLQSADGPAPQNAPLASMRSPMQFSIGPSEALTRALRPQAFVPQPPHQQNQTEQAEITPDELDFQTVAYHSLQIPNAEQANNRGLLGLALFNNMFQSESRQ